MNLINRFCFLILITSLMPAVSCKPGLSPEEQLTLDRKLINAVKQHDLEMVKALLKSGAKVRSKSSKGRTALEIAAMECEPEIAQVLIDEGISPKEEIMRSAFSIAAQKCGTAMVQLMIKSVDDINEPDGVGYTPLHRACLTGRLPVIQILVENGAAINGAKGSTKDTPLHMAVDKGHYKVVEYLIKKGADVNAMGSLGPPLHKAAYLCDVKMAKLLLDNGADVNISRDKNDPSWTALRVCTDSTRSGSLYRSKYQIRKMADLLKSHGGH